jgi:folylpolyglutamate synthase/dihydropteroate synthase
MALPEASPALRDAERYLGALEVFGMRFGLERMRRLMTVLGSPQEQFTGIQVVGSNGKSSTARMISALLEQAGMRTGAPSPARGSRRRSRARPMPRQRSTARSRREIA